MENLSEISSGIPSGILLKLKIHFANIRECLIQQFLNWQFAQIEQLSLGIHPIIYFSMGSLRNSETFPRNLWRNSFRSYSRVFLVIPLEISRRSFWKYSGEIPEKRILKQLLNYLWRKSCINETSGETLKNCLRNFWKYSRRNP